LHFDFTQRFAAPIADVADAFCDPGYYEALAAAPKLGTPEVLSRTATGDKVELRVHYRFAGELAPAARAVLDPAKLTWVEESSHDLATRRVTFVLKPDHYADRFQAHGSYWFESAAADDSVTVRHAEGEVKVRAPLVASSVERAIISGLKEHLDDEVALLESWLARA
jgi:hypothetical protein